MNVPFDELKENTSYIVTINRTINFAAKDEDSDAKYPPAIDEVYNAKYLSQNELSVSFLVEGKIGNRIIAKNIIKSIVKKIPGGTKRKNKKIKKSRRKLYK